MGVNVQDQSEEAQKFKEDGNEAFKNNDFDLAIKLYTKAINLTPQECKELAVYYKNRAAAYLKREKYEEALSDCDRSLEITPSDPKALFRRSQALENLQRYEEAYRDARQILNDDPNNKTVQPTLERLHRIVQDRVREHAQTHTKIEHMTKMAVDLTAPKDKRETAVNNLIVLAREHAGAEYIIKTGVVQQIKKLLKVETDKEIYVAGVRMIGELCKHDVKKTIAVLKDVGIPWFLEILDSDYEERVNAAQYCMQAILNSFSGMDNKPDSKPIKERCDKYKKDIDTLLSCLVYSVNNRAISGIARDAVIELIMKNVDYSALNWAERLVEIGGIARLMECASELEEYKYESAMNITPSTRTLAAVCLSRVYDCMYYDAARAKFMEKVEDFIKSKLLTPDIESKVRVAVAITSLLRGPLDVGNAVIGKEGILEMILVMANTEDALQQKVACECIVAAASKADKAKAIIGQGVDILKRLYVSKNDEVRVRALVGLCKLGSSGGTDAAKKPFAEGSTLKLAEACRKFLLHPGKSQDLRKWAAEGFSYLTLDAEVKEKLIEDQAALTALIELAKTGDRSVLYGVITTLVNLVNAYEKQEVIPEMIELAKFAKQHIPEESELDDPDFVQKRILILGKVGVTSALVALAKTESLNSRELIARVFNALCSEQELRGVIVQQGGAKVLLPMSLSGTEKGKRHAAQALARIGTSINPEVAFPGQRALEVIRPLLALLHPDCTGLENFEAMLALCNIAQMGETARQRILKEGGLTKIENYAYEDHTHLCRAAVQCICNLTLSEDVVKVYEGENDRVKFLVTLGLDEDEETMMAASGALAILTGASRTCCGKVFDAKCWLECLQCLLSHKNANVQYRGLAIVRNVIGASRELAEKLVETNVFEILLALSRQEEAERGKIRELAEEALKEVEELGLIRKPGEFDPANPTGKPICESDDEED